MWVYLLLGRRGYYFDLECNLVFYLLAPTDFSTAMATTAAFVGRILQADSVAQQDRPKETNNPEVLQLQHQL